MKIIACALISFTLIKAVTCHADESAEFQKLRDARQWEQKFHDTGGVNWRDHWFLDGEHATITNAADGMHFHAGSVVGDDADHAVLWTKDSFAGDLKITFTYTRTDAETANVNILYLQATGTGTPPYVADIFEWRDLRKVPAMNVYFQNMNTLHISFAAFGNKGPEKGTDYVRVRRYPVRPGVAFNDLEIPPDYKNTGLFVPGETYPITVIKTDAQLFFHVQGKAGERLFTWNVAGKPKLSAGRIGLRHMFGRAACYQEISVSVRPADNVPARGQNITNHNQIK